MEALQGKIKRLIKKEEGVKGRRKLASAFMMKGCENGEHPPNNYLEEIGRRGQNTLRISITN